MRQADTAATVYHQDIEPTLESRQRFVREHLREFILAHREAPTALELLQFTQQRNPLMTHLDVNTIRPRLTSLHDMGLVRTGEKRRCKISGKTVFTWELSEPRAVTAEPEPQHLF